jgi:hypothetical protein
VSTSKYAKEGEELGEQGVDLLGAVVAILVAAVVTHQFTDNGKEADDLNTCLLHASVGDVADEGRVGSRGLAVCPDRVASFAEREGQERGADVSGDTCNDDLSLVGGGDCFPESGIVPSIDLSLSLDKGSLGVLVGDLLEERAGGT